MDIIIGFLAVAVVIYYFVQRKSSARISSPERDEKEGDRVVHTLHAYNSDKERIAYKRGQSDGTAPLGRNQEYLHTAQQFIGKHGRLQALFDGMFRYLKGELERAAIEAGVELSGRLPRELTYVLLYITTTLLFRCAARESPASASDRLSMSSLRELAEREGVRLETLVDEYQARFARYKKVELLMTKDGFLAREGSMIVGQNLTGKNAAAIFGALAITCLASTIEPLRKGIAELEY